MQTNLKKKNFNFLKTNKLELLTTFIHIILSYLIFSYLKILLK